MKKKQAKKLQLHRETLRNLDRGDLRAVAGASHDTCPVSLCEFDSDAGCTCLPPIIVVVTDDGCLH
jgi:hypothetical protein